MPATPLRLSPSASVSRIIAPKAPLSAEEWGLILKALSAYRHNVTYRELYEKLALRTALS